MSRQRILILATQPGDGGCSLCSVVMKAGVAVTPEAETTISIGHQQSRLCRRHLMELERTVRRWRKNLVKQ